MEVEILRNIKTGSYVEFNIDGDREQFSHWSSESLFLDDAVFGIFLEPFEASVQKFIHYGPTLYEGETLSKLIVELEKFNEIWMDVDSAESCLNVLSSFRLARNFFFELEKSGKTVAQEWKMLLSGFQNINSSLIDMVRKCKFENRVLWVLDV